MAAPTRARTRKPTFNTAIPDAELEPDSAPVAPEAVVVPEVTGYNTTISFYSTRYKQGGRTVYSLDLSLAEILSLITKPDPTMRMPGNRMIRVTHAQDFAKYLRTSNDWVSPGMLFRTPSSFDFAPITSVNGTEFGVISFDRAEAAAIHIIDGQHRVYGLHLAKAAIDLELDKARSALASARRVEANGSAVKNIQKQVDALKGKLDKFAAERISVQILVIDDIRKYRQLFVDINGNALGVSGSVTARYDMSKVVNRVLEDVSTHPLLAGRVEEERDTLRKDSPYLISAKHVADITRNANIGLEGRYSVRGEKEAVDREVAQRSLDYFSALVAGFPQMENLIAGTLTPSLLRKTSLLGSVVTLRVLAGVFRELKGKHAFNDHMVIEFFRTLAPHMTGPIFPESVWMANMPLGTNYEGTVAIGSRLQSQRAAMAALIGWAIDKPEFLNQVAPRPVIEVEEASTEEEMRVVDEILSRKDAVS